MGGRRCGWVWVCTVGPVGCISCRGTLTPYCTMKRLMEYAVQFIETEH